MHAAPNPCPVVMADIVVGAGFMTPSDIVAVGNEYINGGWRLVRVIYISPLNGRSVLVQRAGQLLNWHSYAG